MRHGPPAIDDVAQNIKNDLRPAPNPNPPVPCGVCDESYKLQDYWEPRYIDSETQAPDMHWICDECVDKMYAEYRLYKRKENHRTLTEWEK